MDQEKIGKLIAKLRKSKGLTQRELGEMVGVGFRAVSKWETGLTSPDISIINDLSKILGISADELLKGEVNKKETKPIVKKKNIIYIAIILIVVLVLIMITIIINSNKTFVYNLITPNPDYYIEGEVIFARKNISLKINSIGFEDSTFEQTVIKNYQYEILCDDILIVGYGYIPTYQSLPSPTTIEKWRNKFIINYNGDIEIKEQKIIKKGLTLKITFIDNQNNIIAKDIKIILKKQKISHST